MLIRITSGGLARRTSLFARDGGRTAIVKDRSMVALIRGKGGTLAPRLPAAHLPTGEERAGWNA
jgi:hypothetical protein